MPQSHQMFTYQKRLRFWQLIRFWAGGILAAFSFTVASIIWIGLLHAFPPVWDPISPLILLLMFMTGLALVISAFIEDYRDSRLSPHR